MPTDRKRIEELRRLFDDRDAGVDAGANEHYHDTSYYDDTYDERAEDVSYYIELLAGYRGEVLEYGCGTGRITIPLAVAGCQVTGVDRSRAMLTKLRARVSELETLTQRRIRSRRGDMRSLRLKRQFGYVLCTFNTFLHLYTRRDVERFLATVRSHLTKDGRFVFDVSVPDPDELARSSAKLYRSPAFLHPGVGQKVGYGERFDYDALRQVLYVTMEFEPKGSKKNKQLASAQKTKPWSTMLTHRQFYPQELEALLHYNGLSLVQIDGDFKREEPQEGATSIAYHCKLRRAWTAK